MTFTKNIVRAGILVIVFNGCFTEPNYPIFPQIEILNDEITFGKSINTNQMDSIKVVIKFQDGDGDLGLNTDDRTSNFDYAQQYYYTFPAKEKVTSFNNRRVITLKDKQSDPNLTLDGKPLPEFVTPFSCTNWEPISNTNPVEHRYTEFNPNHYNIFVDFFTLNSDGSFTKFEPKNFFIYPSCSTEGYNGAFPILSKDLSKKSPLDGKLVYTIRGFALFFLFQNKTLKLKISIQDRALNKSNEVETKNFTLR